MKRQPLLADKFAISKTTLTTKQFHDSTRANLLEAKRFVLDEEATLCIADMIVETPRIIADAQDFAIPPFQKTWIEFPFDVFWERINKQPMDENADSQMGFLIVGNTVRIIVGGNQLVLGNDAIVMPFEYHLWQPLTVEEEMKFIQECGSSRLMLDYIYWGSSAVKLQGDDGDSGVECSLRALRENHSLHISTSPRIDAKTIFDHVVKENSGDLRNLIAMLLFLNRTREVQIVNEVPHGRGMIHNKSSTFLKHSVIKLKLNPKPLIRKLVAGQGAWKRLHDVRGHFCHNARAREAGSNWCAHEEWVEYEPRRWRCSACGGKRWWQPQHKRGHDEKGIITSEYHVTK